MTWLIGTVSDALLSRSTKLIKSPPAFHPVTTLNGNMTISPLVKCTSTLSTQREQDPCATDSRLRKSSNVASISGDWTETETTTISEPINKHNILGNSTERSIIGDHLVDNRMNLVPLKAADQLLLADIPKMLPLKKTHNHQQGENRRKRLKKVDKHKRKEWPSRNRININLFSIKFSSSILTILLLVLLEVVLLSQMTAGAKTFYVHWNTSNSIFRIDNTDHIIDVNKGNLEFEYDQVHLICPVYEAGTFENETEKYIIYNVSKVEYETCRITNANPRIIAICDKPQNLMFITITFRPFTPQPGGLEFLPGQDYYFISTSSKDDLHRRIGGRCSTNNMKVVFKVCCEKDTHPSTPVIPPLQKSTPLLQQNSTSVIETPTADGESAETGLIDPSSNRNYPNGGSTMGWPPSPSGNGNAGWSPYPPNYNHRGMIPSTPTDSNIYRHPSYGGGIRHEDDDDDNYRHPYLTSLRPNNTYGHHSSSKPTKKTSEYGNKHPNEVVKNEELSYNSYANTKRLFGKQWNLKGNSILSKLLQRYVFILVISVPIIIAHIDLVNFGYDYYYSF